MQQYPFLTLKQSLLILRIAVAVIFLAHAIVRICNGSIPQFSEFMESKGLPYGVAWVWAIIAYEITGGILLLLGKYTRWLSTGFIILLLVGIVLIHASLGWFVGEHGTGGCEYSVLLIVALLVIAAAQRERIS